MKFGPLPTDEAAGAALAHTLRAGGQVFKKGRILDPSDLAVLRSAGYDEIVAARLEPGDVAEGEAAAAIGAALAGDGLRAAEAFTGRCNLYATRRGLVVADRTAIDALNGVDEAVTLASLPGDSVVEVGAMVATAKIIPFALPRSVLDRALETGTRGGAPLGVRPFRALRAGLILTELPGTRPAVLERAAQSQRLRLERLGGELARELLCAHDAGAVAEAIETLRRERCDPILILGASAIVDREDVVPAALRAAGGRVERLGMPVDPGNLLLFGRHGDGTVIGVPGCARSPKPSGFDTVLARVAAGLPVESGDLAALGVGGLLKEVAGRPQPRGAARGDAAPALRETVGAVVLAAGQSRRMPDANKLLLPIDGTPMVARVVDTLLDSGVARPVVVVTGHEADGVEAALAGREVSFTHNPHYEDGMSGSLRAGLDALDGKVGAALVCLGDMPWVNEAVLAALVSAWDPEDPRICVPIHDRKRGNPVLWPARFFEAMRAIRGDQGARRLLDDNAEEITFVPVGDDGVNRDVDTPDALA